MARLTSWRIWAPALLVLAILVAALPPSYREGYVVRDRHSLRTSFTAAESRVQEQAERLAWAPDALPEKLRGLAVVRRGPLLVASSDQVSARVRDAWVLAVTRDAALFPGAGVHPDGAVTLVLAARQSGGGRRALSWYSEHAFPVPLGEPCVLRVDNISLRGTPEVTESRAKGIIGQCSLSLAYGRPGTAVRSWAARIRNPFRFRPRALLDTEWVPPAYAADQVRVSWDSYQFDYLQGTFGHCAGGDGASCAYLLDAQGAGENGGRRSAFIWWLINKDQGRSFARFWRHDGTLNEASLAAFGASFDQLAAAWLRPRLVLPPSGPQLPEGAVPKTAAILALSALGAMLGLRRRQAA